MLTRIVQTADERLTVALVHPDIPQNAGNIARLCLAAGCRLVLVRPLGFRLADPHLLRAGMDYWKNLAPLILDDLIAFQDWAKGRRLLCLSSHGDKNYAEVNYSEKDVLCLGSETEGLPEEILNHAKETGNLLVLPMAERVRCLNVSSAAAAVVYEAVRQLQGWNRPI